MYVAVADKIVADDVPYTFDYTSWSLLTPTEKIVSATASATQAGLTVGLASVNAAGDQVQVEISGGTAGVTYRVEVVATTTSGYDIVGPADIRVN